MTTRRVIVPALQGVTLIALIAAALLLAWPARVHATDARPVLPTQVADVPAPVGDVAALADSVVNTNMFSLTREAPEDRTFVAAPTDAPAEDVTAGEYGADAGIGDSTAIRAAETDAVPALHGIVNGPLGRAALLHLDPGTPGSRLFRTGDGTAGYRVRSIGADRVELIGPSGPVVLELVAKGDAP